MCILCQEDKTDDLTQFPCCGLEVHTQCFKIYNKYFVVCFKCGEKISDLPFKINLMWDNWFSITNELQIMKNIRRELKGPVCSVRFGGTFRVYLPRSGDMGAIDHLVDERNDIVSEIRRALSDKN